MSVVGSIHRYVCLSRRLIGRDGVCPSGYLCLEASVSRPIMVEVLLCPPVAVVCLSIWEPFACGATVCVHIAVNLGPWACLPQGIGVPFQKCGSISLW